MGIPKISMVAATTLDNVIGSYGSLPWYIPSDLARFHKLTKGKLLVMGRKTFESIIRLNGQPLVERVNVVLTRRDIQAIALHGGHPATSMRTAIEMAGDREEIFVIGGEQVYHQFMPLADRLYITNINSHTGGDAHFPSLTLNEWNLAKDSDTEIKLRDPRDEYQTSHLIFDRK